MIVKGGYNSPQKYKRAGASWKAAKFKAVGASLAHLKYIKNRPGDDLEKGGREFFDAEEDKVNEKEFNEEVRKIKGKGPVVHKILLAPDVTPVDSKEFTREVMKELANSKGLELKWQAVEHRNTDNPHVHVVLLGKDKNGKEVRLNKRDYNKLREHGGRILDRDYPLAREEKRRERDAKELEKREQRKKERQEKKERGMHLPWLKQKVIREINEPYSDWKRAQEEKELLPEPEDVEKGSGKEPKSIVAMGRNWSGENSLEELQKLDEQLREKFDNRIPLKDYKELTSWIEEKEKDQRIKIEDKSPDKFKYAGKEYTKNSSREELEKLNKYLYESRDEKDKKLPRTDYMKLRTWLEDKDRKYMAEFVGSHAEKLIERDQRAKEDVNEKVGGRIVDPMQQEVGANPALGAIVKAGQFVSMAVGQVRLDDIRDPLAEAHQYLMTAYGEVDEFVQDKAADQKDVTEEEKTLEQLDEGIEKVKEQKAERQRQEKEKREEAERRKEREYRDGFMGLD